MTRPRHVALIWFVVFALGAALAARQAAPQTFSVAQGSEIRIPPTWTRSPVTYGNATELVFVRPATAADARETAPEARILVTTEPRLSHADAVKRLGDIARERDGKKQFVAISGWPALEMTFVEPLPVRGEQQPTGEPAPTTAFVQRGTTAIAAESRVIRFDITLSPGVETGVLASAQEIARSANFTAKQPPAALQNDMRRLSATPGIGRAPAVEFIGMSAHAAPAARKTAATATGAGVLVQGGVGELEVASSADASHVVVASNAALSVSTNGGSTFTAGTTGVFGLNDPSLARGASGNFYLDVIAFPNGSAAHLNQSGCANANSRSTDGGATFNLQGFSTVCANTGTAMCFPDQEHIAADAVTQSGSNDQVYAVWRNFVPSGTLPAACRNIQTGIPTTSITCSQDNGQTWTARAAVAGAGDFPRVAVGRDGSVYVVSLSGSSVLLNKFSSCSSGLTAVAGFPVTPASLSGNVSCPVAGLDRCNNGNTLSSPTVAPDPDITNRIFVAFAERDGSGGERVVITQSSDGGLTFPTRATVSGTISARRFMPWACSTRGRAFAGWYDRRASAATGAATNDLTDYILGEAKPSIGGTGALSAGFIRKLTTDPDPQCASGWPCSPRSSGDSEACTTQPQRAGFCSGTGARCDFSTGCSGTQTCLTGGGCPKYGDYNGIACAGDYVIGAWSSATPPSGITAPAGINVFASAEYIGPPPFTCARFPGTCIRPTRFEKDILVVLCATLPCKVFDPIPRNCLVKWDCPVCDPRGGGLCPPYYHIVFDDTLKGWTPSITDADGVTVPHRVYDVAGHTIVSVRPTRAGSNDGKIANVNLVLTSGPGVRRGVEYKIHARLETSDKPRVEPDRIVPRVP